MTSWNVIYFISVGIFIRVKYILNFIKLEFGNSKILLLEIIRYETFLNIKTG